MTGALIKERFEISDTEYGLVVRLVDLMETLPNRTQN